MISDGLKEYIRKSIHLSSLVIPFAYQYVFGYNRFLMFVLLFMALIISLGIELSRIQIPTFGKLFSKLFGLVLRRHERKDFTGATFLIFASMLCVVFFNPTIAFLSICYLSIGDTFAAIVGKAVGIRKFNGQRKSLEGSLACFTSILVFSILFGTGINPLIYVAGSLAATLAELWNIPIDDNVKIPVLSGIVMTLVSIIV